METADESNLGAARAGSATFGAAGGMALKEERRTLGRKILKGVSSIANLRGRARA